MSLFLSHLRTLHLFCSFSQFQFDFHVVVSESLGQRLGVNFKGRKNFEIIKSSLINEMEMIIEDE